MKRVFVLSSRLVSNREHKSVHNAAFFWCIFSNACKDKMHENNLIIYVNAQCHSIPFNSYTLIPRHLFY